MVDILAMFSESQDVGVQEMQIFSCGVRGTLGLLQAIAQLSVIPAIGPPLLRMMLLSVYITYDLTYPCKNIRL